MHLPRRVFLDANVVNFILDHDGCIFENEPMPQELPERDKEDIDSLQAVFATGERAMWELAVSPITYREISATTDPLRRYRLQRWFGEIWTYWRDCYNEDGTLNDDYAIELSNKLSPSQVLSAFPDRTDRELICHAIAYECDAFCTRDHKTILNRRERVSNLPLAIISPNEWWQTIKPYCGLWR